MPLTPVPDGVEVVVPPDFLAALAPEGRAQWAAFRAFDQPVLVLFPALDIGTVEALVENLFGVTDKVAGELLTALVTTANMGGAVVADSWFESAEATGISFRGARFNGLVDFGHAVLEGADFRDTTLSGMMMFENGRMSIAPVTASAVEFAIDPGAAEDGTVENRIGDVDEALDQPRPALRPLKLIPETKFQGRPDQIGIDEQRRPDLGPIHRQQIVEDHRGEVCPPKIGPAEIGPRPSGAIGHGFRAANAEIGPGEDGLPEASPFAGDAGLDAGEVDPPGVGSVEQER